MNAEIFVIPWPAYSDTGAGPFWAVRVESSKFRGVLTWSTTLGRFRKSNQLFRLRRGQPKVFREAVAVMVTFCSKLQQHGGDICASRRGHSGDMNQAEGDISEGHGRGHSRARAEPSAYVPDVPGGHIGGDGDISSGHSTLSPDGIGLRRPAVLPEGIERPCDCFGGVCAAPDPRPMLNQGVRPHENPLGAPCSC